MDKDDKSTAHAHEASHLEYANNALGHTLLLVSPLDTAGLMAMLLASGRDYCVWSASLDKDPVSTTLSSRLVSAQHKPARDLYLQAPS